jgi:hypothetical protein
MSDLQPRAGWPNHVLWELRRMKPTITPLRDLRGRKITGYRAEFGPIDATATTKPAAIAAAELAVQDALDRLNQGARVTGWIDPAGRVRPIMVAPTINGWGYWLDFFSRPYVEGSYGSAGLAENAGFHHVAQNAWTADVDDRAFLLSLPAGIIRAELASWIGFQRAYLRERAAGTPENQIHQIACNRPERIDLPI